MRLKQNLLHLPPGMDIVTFVEFDGKPPREIPEKDAVMGYLFGLDHEHAASEAVGSREQKVFRRVLKQDSAAGYKAPRSSLLRKPCNRNFPSSKTWKKLASSGSMGRKAR